MKKSCHVHWRDSGAGTCSVRHTGGGSAMSIQLRQSIWRDSWSSRVNLIDVISVQNRTETPLSLSSSLSSFILSSSCGGSITDFGLLSPILRTWCHKSTLWVGILFVLGTYIIFTVSFCCIFKFPLEWTHVVGIWDESNIIVISMKWLYCMND
jgi:hypothetical protein